MQRINSINGWTRAYLTDYAFATYLNRKDPKWTYEKVCGEPFPCTRFVTSTGKIIAIVFYNNRLSTHKIFLPDKETRNDE